MASAVDTSKYVIPDYGSLSQQLSSGIDNLIGISERNSARSAAEAETMRQWQSEQYAKQMEFNAQEAAKNRSWQEMMSNTAHQREVADLKAAGLNPVLSASGGNGAAVGSGATASAALPSGSKGDVDTSASSAIVNLLTSFLSAQTSMTESAMSAVQAHALADKSAAVSEMVAEIGAQATRDSAETHAGATRYSADRSASASMYGSERSAEASMYGSDKSSSASRYGSMLDYKSDRENRTNQLRLQSRDQEWNEAHPNTNAGLISSALNVIAGGAGHSNTSARDAFGVVAPTFASVNAVYDAIMKKLKK